MLTIFKHGRFDEYLKKLSELGDDDFTNAALMQEINAQYDIYEGE